MPAMHRIGCGDEQPTNDPYRRITPKLIAECRNLLSRDQRLELVEYLWASVAAPPVIAAAVERRLVELLETEPHDADKICEALKSATAVLAQGRRKAE
jgi:uncharacterized tellurite resistance protein B-like protein